MRFLERRRRAAIEEPIARETATLQAALAAAEREALRLGRILAAMPDGVLLVSGDDVVYANPAAGPLLGGDPARIVPSLRAERGDSFTISVHHPIARDVQCIRAPLDQATTLVVARDVTEASRLDRMRQDFVANASHELKTPVSAILATAETLRTSMGDDPATSERFVATLAREAGHLSSLVMDLLDLARLDQAAQPIETVELASVVEEVVANFRQRGRERGIEVSAELAANDTFEVRHRRGDLALCLSNLLDNALRYAPSGGQVVVRLARVNGDAILQVADTGEGIPAKDLPRIFERFYRVDRARSRDTGGTGLGLAIVRHIAETAGGRATVESTYGQGSTFTVTLPLA